MLLGLLCLGYHSHMRMCVATGCWRSESVGARHGQNIFDKYEWGRSVSPTAYQCTCHVFGQTHQYGSNLPGMGHEEPDNYKSAHTALAVKACLLGGNSNTKCSMTFVNIAVAISALAGGGPKTVSHRDHFRHFSRIFGCLSARGYWNGILLSGNVKTAKNEKNIVHSKILQGFWMPEHWKHCKNKCFGLTL